MAFKVRDLMVNVIPRGNGNVALLPPDAGPIPTRLTPITPIISVLAQKVVLDRARVVLQEKLDAAVESKEALYETEIVELVREVGAEVGVAVVSAMFAGGRMLPDPNCGGTSYETIPTPITPYVQKARFALADEYLPYLKHQLKESLRAVELAEEELMPRASSDIESLSGHLKESLESLQQRQPVQKA